VPQQFWLPGDLQSPDRIDILHQFLGDLADVIQVAAGVDAPGDGEAQQLVGGIHRLAGGGVIVTKHQAANLHGAHAAFDIQHVRQGSARELRWRDVRQGHPGVHIHRVPARRFINSHASRLKDIPEVAGVALAVIEVIRVDPFVHSLGNGFKITPGKPAVGDKALMDDQFLGDPELQFLIPQPDETADIDDGVLLGAHGAAVSIGEHLPDDFRDGLFRIVLISLLDEPGILGKAAGVDEKGDAVFVINLPGLANVVHGDGLTGGRIVGDGDHPQGDILRADFIDESFQPFEVHIPLERQVDSGIFCLRDDEVHRVGTDLGDICLSGVKVAVVGDVLPGLD